MNFRVMIAALAFTFSSGMAAAQDADTLRDADKYDINESLQDLRAQAEADDPAAQFGLGVLYTRGGGVPHDHTKAADWYRKAAEQGHANAQLGLGELYYAGNGVILDQVYAHAWAHLAAAQGLEEAKELRDHIQSSLTSTQLTEAQRIASSWKPGSPLSLGEGVAFVQRGLAELGYNPGPADGKPGPQTRSAVSAFQRDNGLPADGEISAMLEQALMNALDR